MKFTEFDLNSELLKGIDDAGFETCTQVQEETLTKTLKENKDVCVQSQTGTGKTAAFLITIFELFQRKISEGKKPSALIVAPTRELAIQIEEEAIMLGKHMDIKTCSFYGGVSYSKQEAKLSHGVDIYIGTPGRLIDFMKSKKLNFSNLDILVLDEADRMFDMGFFPDIKFIMRKLPSKEKRRTLLFSATLAYRVRNIAWEYMNFPEEIDIKTESVTVNDIDQKLIHTGSNEKMKLLLGILKHEKVKNMIIFANTKAMSVEISKRLEINGYASEYIIGDLPQNKRIKIINGLKSGEIKYLVATDVAARGLHVDNLEMVVNYDLPEDSENYVHRIGRTARAGNKGHSYSFACEHFVRGLEGIESYIGSKIPVVWIEDDYLVEDASAGMRIEDPFRKKNRSNRSSSKPTTRRRTSENRSDNRDQNRRKHNKKEFDRKENHSNKNSTSRNSTNEASTNRTTTNKNANVNVKRPKSNGDIDQRLEYYKQKYGEDFAISENKPKKSKPKKVKNKNQKPLNEKAKKEKQKSGLFSKIKKALKK